MKELQQVHHCWLPSKRTCRGSFTWSQGYNHNLWILLCCRGYNKCTTAGCPVREHVEGASHGLKAIITTMKSNTTMMCMLLEEALPIWLIGHFQTTITIKTSQWLRPSAMTSQTNQMTASHSIFNPPYNVDIQQKSINFGFSGGESSLNYNFAYNSNRKVLLTLLGLHVPCLEESCSHYQQLEDPEHTVTSMDPILLTTLPVGKCTQEGFSSREDTQNSCWWKKCRGCCKGMWLLRHSNHPEYAINLTVPADFGRSDDVINSELQRNEIHLLELTIHGLKNGLVCFPANTWIYSSNDNPQSRILFSNQVQRQ